MKSGSATVSRAERVDSSYELLSLLSAEKKLAQELELGERAEREKLARQLMESERTRSQQQKKMLELESRVAHFQATASSKPQSGFCSACCQEGDRGTKVEASDYYYLDGLCEQLTQENSRLKVQLAIAVDAKNSLLSDMAATAAETGKDASLMFLIGHLSARQKGARLEERLNLAESELAKLEADCVSELVLQEEALAKGSLVINQLAEQLSAC